MRVVIDTNVIVSGLRSRNGYSFKLLSRIPEKSFEICISVPLILEYEAILKKQMKYLSLKQIDDFINYVCLVSKHTKIHYLWRPIVKDPFDDHILELAVNAQAKYILTYNVKDFSQCSEFGIKVMKPKAFLQELGEIK